MALTRSYTHTIVERARCDPEFAKILLDEAVTLFLNGEQEMARMIFRDIVYLSLVAREQAPPPQGSHAPSEGG
jgi:hypothetical protein